jgi:hypothetical protein
VGVPVVAAVPVVVVDVPAVVGEAVADLVAAADARTSLVVKE